MCEQWEANGNGVKDELRATHVEMEEQLEGGGRNITGVQMRHQRQTEGDWQTKVAQEPQRYCLGLPVVIDVRNLKWVESVQFSLAGMLENKGLEYWHLCSNASLFT